MTDFEIVASTVDIDGGSRVSLDASVSNSGDTSALSDLRITAENTGDSVFMLSSAPPLPFGILVASERSDPSSNFTLWSESYPESEYLTVDGKQIVSSKLVNRTTALDPGESASAVYRLYDGIDGLDDTADTIRTGTYLLQDADRNPFTVDGYGVELEITDPDAR